ncbi:MAG: LysR family transcriptional regulator [Verrucomicrobia bacterium]|nr:MAG: LysR family transcriptional regulator [Verrucomicrobiota bacterium]
MSFLNYHHLRYFRAIANHGTLTGAAQRLGISQSSLSVQLKQLEESIGQPLFSREHKTLILTESGRIALQYAEGIFRAGEEMMSMLENRTGGKRTLLRVGSVATLSRNFQLVFLRSLINRPDVELVIRSGNLRDLLAQLRIHQLDLVLSNLPVHRDAETQWHSHLLDQQPVALVGRKQLFKKKRMSFPSDLANVPLVLPSLDSSLRASFDLLLEMHGIFPNIAAEVDDMAMLRLLAREGAGLALVPPVVVETELKRGELVIYHRFADIQETFYAISPTRQFPNPLVIELLESRSKK